MLKFIRAKWTGTAYHDGDWVYQLPIGKVFSKNRVTEEDIPILKTDDTVLGYATPGWYAIEGDIFLHDAAMSHPNFQGETATLKELAIRRAQLQKMELEEGCYGD